MKKLILLAVSIATITTVNAQVLKRITQRAKNKVEQKAGDKVDKEIDDAVDGNKKEKKQTEESTTENSQEETTASASSGNDDSKSSEPASMKAYSKYDFIPGEKVFAYEDFSTAELGDFPQRWNTNGTAEIVKLSTKAVSYTHLRAH